MNPSETALLYGVAGTFDRWDGQGFAYFGHWHGSLDQWGGFGEVSHGQFRVRAIGLTAPAHRSGPVEYVSIPPLNTGSYRLGVAGTAFGLLRVTAGAPPAPIVTNPPTLTAHPVLVPPVVGEVGLVGFPPPTGVQTIDQVMQFNHDLVPTTALERLQGDTWVHISTLDVHPPLPPLIHPAEVAVTIPALSPGSYRLVRSSPTVGDVYRQIWVIEPPPAIGLGHASKGA
jgi:hypothetical protein